MSFVKVFKTAIEDVKLNITRASKNDSEFSCQLVNIYLTVEDEIRYSELSEWFKKII